MTAVHRTAETVATSRADESAFRALLDAAAITADLGEARIVGGQMVSLLTFAFPDAPRIDRRTADADLGISTEIAGAGTVHARLTALGYTATSGNHYEHGSAQIDVLAPSLTGRFSSASIAGRGIDLTPGLGLALAGEPITIDLGITLLDASHERASVRVPTVDVAVILKAAATRSRAQPKDITDLYNLLSIAYAYPAAESGGWSLSRPGLLGARRDAARTLHDLADRATRIRMLGTAGVPVEGFVALVRELVARPAR